MLAAVNLFGHTFVDRLILNYIYLWAWDVGKSMGITDFINPIELDKPVHEVSVLWTLFINVNYYNQH